MRTSMNRAKHGRAVPHSSPASPMLFSAPSSPASHFRKAPVSVALVVGTVCYCGTPARGAAVPNQTARFRSLAPRKLCTLNLRKGMLPDFAVGIR
jgi:hypothetical protein